MSEKQMGRTIINYYNDRENQKLEIEYWAIHDWRASIPTIDRPMFMERDSVNYEDLEKMTAKEFCEKFMPPERPGRKK